MARNRNLAGLAALGALGYMMTRGGEKKDVPVEDRSASSGAQGLAGSSAEEDADYAREAARGGRGQIAVMPGRAPVSAQAPANAIPLEVPSRGRREMLKNPQRGPAASDLEGMRAERATNDRLNELTREMNRGQRGKIAATGYQNPQRGPSFEEVQEKNAQDRMDALRASGGMRAKGGAIKMASGGSTSSASRRADGIAQRGKTRGRMR